MDHPENMFPVACYGEILWDILPMGPLPGGAPMNVAFHLKRLGIEPALVTRVGQDELAGLIAQLLQGKSPPEALAYAGAVGALVAGRHGACPWYDSAEIGAMMKGNGPMMKGNGPMMKGNTEII